MNNEAWSLAIQVVAICAAAAVGAVCRPRTAMLTAIAGGLLTNVAAQVVLAEGGPGACVGFVLLPGYCVGAAMGGVVLRGFIRRPRHRAGRCDRCGYDLTGNVSGVCPECGKPLYEDLRASAPRADDSGDSA